MQSTERAAESDWPLKYLFYDQYYYKIHFPEFKALNSNTCFLLFTLLGSLLTTKTDVGGSSITLVNLYRTSWSYVTSQIMILSYTYA
jgi:hypothetical protein